MSAERKELTVSLLLLILIGAILLAAVAPKLTDAEIRKHLAQVSSDLKEIATAVEAYKTDFAAYPNDAEYGWPYILTHNLTSPVAYLPPERFAKLRDPFRPEDKTLSERLQHYHTAYRYINYPANDSRPGKTWKYLPNNPRPVDWLLKEDEWKRAVAKYGLWRLNSSGPDGFSSFDLRGSQDGSIADTGPGPWANWFVLCMVYDPTNGMVSCGDIMRCQKTGEVTSVTAAEQPSSP